MTQTKPTTNNLSNFYKENQSLEESSGSIPAAAAGVGVIPTNNTASPLGDGRGEDAENLYITSPNKESHGTQCLQWLQNDWYYTVPEKHGVTTPEQRKEWFKEHTFTHYLAALIILDILVLNDRALDFIEKSEEAKGGSEADDSLPTSD